MWHIAVNKAIGAPYDTPEGNLGDAYLILDRDDEALAIFKKQNHPIRMGRYYLKKKDYQRALEQFDRDRERYEKAKRAEFMIAQWIGLGLSSEGLKKYEEAYNWYKKTTAFMEEQRMALAPAEREHYFEGNEVGFPRIEAYEGAVRCAFMLNRLDEAFFWAENTRGRIFSELLSHRHEGENYKLPPKLAQDEDGLVNQITMNKKGQQAAFEKNNPELLSRLEKEYSALTEKMDGFVGQLRREYPQYAAIKYPQPVKLSQLALAKGETILEYEVTEPYTIGLVIRDGKVVKGFKVEKTRGKLENLVRKFRSPFQDGGDPGSFSLNAAKELTDFLLVPALPLLTKGGRLIIVPDESLSLLPFEALLLAAPPEVLKAEAAMLAQADKQEGGALDRRAIVRGLAKPAVTRGAGVVAPRVSTPILFETGSAKISRESQKLMEEILAALKAQELQSAAIRIEGHTDQVGDPGYNLKLSLRRAQAVKDYLTKNGIAATRLRAYGKGDTEPIADNRTEAGRRQNRRVDFVRMAGSTEAPLETAAMPKLVYAIDEYPVSYYQSASVLSLQRGLHIVRAKEKTFFGLGDPVFGPDDKRAEKLRGVAVIAKKDAGQPDIAGSEGTKEAGYSFGRLPNTEKEVREVGRLF